MTHILCYGLKVNSCNLHTSCRKQEMFFVLMQESKTTKHSVSSHFQSMMDPNPVKRPSAKEILRHHIFEKLHTAPAKK
jgi:serine/threonine protein kinase